jgi:hypothetical protein
MRFYFLSICVNLLTLIVCTSMNQSADAPTFSDTWWLLNIIVGLLFGSIIFGCSFQTIPFLKKFWQQCLYLIAVSLLFLLLCTIFDKITAIIPKHNLRISFFYDGFGLYVLPSLVLFFICWRLNKVIKKGAF